ncbi:MAG: helix-turn-helix transcriptional regulator [Anaeroplasma bactoclasticum]|nr:helix-turn-helix transcriptional regulator [Anaeroplasma bactoclasticum]
MHNRIKEERKKLGITQSELADKVNVSKASISYFESGARKPKLETWNKLADFFGVSVPYLQGKENKDKENDDSLATLFSNVQNDSIQINALKRVLEKVLSDSYYKENFKDFISNYGINVSDLSLKTKRVSSQVADLIYDIYQGDPRAYDALNDIEKILVRYKKHNPKDALF